MARGEEAGGRGGGGRISVPSLVAHKATGFEPGRFC